MNHRCGFLSILPLMTEHIFQKSESKTHIFYNLSDEKNLADIAIITKLTI